LTFLKPFQKVLPALEKELMIIGITAFAFKVILNLNRNLLSDQTIIAFEYFGKRFFYPIIQEIKPR
jgi:hypothetical protein